MKTEDNSQNQAGVSTNVDNHAHPRPFVVSREFQPALDTVLDSVIDTAPDIICPRPVVANDDVGDTGGEPWPLRGHLWLGHDGAVRQTAPGHEQSDAPIDIEPLFEPSAEPRPNVVEHGEAAFSDMVGHGQEVDVLPIIEPPTPNEPTWPVAVEEGDVEIEPVEKVEEQVEVSTIEAPPDTADLVTVEEAVEIFRLRGLPRHMRTIQKYCSAKSGRALVSYQVPTENGIRYMIERSSIDRFIGDAAQQAPTGKIENENIAEPVSLNQNREQAKIEHVSAPVVDQLDIFEHPLVQRLEAQVERLEGRNEQLQANIQNVLEQANERLVELQKASAIAQSESLGKFLLESERIRGGLDSDHGQPVTVHKAGEQFGGIDV